MHDCQECEDPAILKEEIVAADNSVDLAVACLVDLLDELRVSESEVATDSLVHKIKQLRADMMELKKRQDEAQKK